MSIEPPTDSPEGAGGVVGEPGSTWPTRGRRNVPPTPPPPAIGPPSDSDPTWLEYDRITWLRANLRTDIANRLAHLIATDPVLPHCTDPTCPCRQPSRRHA